MKLSEVPEISKEFLEEAGKFLHDDQNTDLVHKYNERYLHWEELKHRKLLLDPIIIWNLMKVSRELKAKNLEFGNWIFKYTFTLY
jgi:hypothetical protein